MAYCYHIMKNIRYKIPKRLVNSLGAEFYAWLYDQYPQHHSNNFIYRNGFLERDITVLELDDTVIIQVVGSPAQHLIIVNERMDYLMINGHSCKRTRKQMNVIQKCLEFAQRVQHTPQLVAV